MHSALNIARNPLDVFSGSQRNLEHSSKMKTMQEALSFQIRTHAQPADKRLTIQPLIVRSAEIFEQVHLYRMVNIGAGGT